MLTAVLFYLLGKSATFQKSAGTSEGGVLINTQKSTEMYLSNVFTGSGQRDSRLMVDVNPFALKANLYGWGYDAAATDLKDALTQLQLLPAVERKHFTFGIFSWVARNRTPADALHVATGLAESARSDALRGLVGEWIFTRSGMAEDHRSYRRDLAFTAGGNRLGLGAELASLISGAELGPDIRSSWIDSFANHSSRSEILLILAGGGNNKGYAESLLERVEGWSSWEKQRASKAILSGLAYSSPEEAWRWYNENPHRFGADHSGLIIEAWASKDFDAVKGLLEATESPDQRSSILKAVAKHLAQQNTEDAVEWADSLSDSGEREKAHAAIYDAAPRGIGAMLVIQEGFPTVHGVVPGSPLVKSGIRVGDQIFEAQEGNAAPRTLYGNDIFSVVNLFRGEPGSTITLRLFRKNTDSGHMEEHTLTVTRAQLYLDENGVPSRFIPTRDQ